MAEKLSVLFDLDLLLIVLTFRHLFKATSSETFWISTERQDTVAVLRTSC